MPFMPQVCSYEEEEEEGEEEEEKGEAICRGSLRTKQLMVNLNYPSSLNLIKYC